ncbi:enoyl-CoA hydratase/isomerase family protein [Steroidobacter sp. S1-65]|uniref:Enoyl-CoA hydratase/isomerase family protein n=1 Tax=Steroidobacter gossypii TaxID=2805490 RepID=A0ABS1X0C2_9GAMM|nr:enoyl-CoA hydratase [Steroidobacter gossypii]MBM0106648.1 enoyl-CoA hydratase/isomerase family protein [Steroidobacter gossypii]
MSEARLVYEKRDVVAHIRFDNPSAHNALTHQMWCDLRDVCRQIAQDPSVRVVTFRGVGGKAFISGTDISGFAGFTSGRDGIAYERHIDECMAAVDALPVTTIAIIEGWAVGGGLNIFSAADFRIATPDARFASPLGRTIANCLSISSCARIAGAIGVTMAKRMLLLGEVVSAQEMMTKGVLYSVVEPAAMDAAVDELCQRAAANAPLTTRASKEMMRRLSYANLPNVDDLIEQVYGSEDFKRGVANFVAKNKTVPQWRGS